MEKKNYCAQTIKSICMNLSLIYAINGVVSNSYSIVQAIFIQVVYIKYKSTVYFDIFTSLPISHQERHLNIKLKLE